MRVAATPQVDYRANVLLVEDRFELLGGRLRAALDAVCNHCVEIAADRIPYRDDDDDNENADRAAAQPWL